jgi:hypothetical protein
MIALFDDSLSKIRRTLTRSGGIGYAAQLRSTSRLLVLPEQHAGMADDRNGLKTHTVMSELVMVACLQEFASNPAG